MYYQLINISRLKVYRIPTWTGKWEGVSSQSGIHPDWKSTVSHNTGQLLEFQTVSYFLMIFK